MDIILTHKRSIGYLLYFTSASHHVVNEYYQSNYQQQMYQTAAKTTYQPEQP